MIRAIVLCMLVATTAQADDAPYAGQQDRTVSSFSEADLSALRSGGGWGLAKPAELNGWPGPRHVLDLATELQLTEQQYRKVQAIFDAMNARARDLGPQLIATEQALDAAFETGKIDERILRRLLADAEAIRNELRETHLSAHLATRPILTRHQRMIYARLRGYGNGDHDHSAHH